MNPQAGQAGQHIQDIARLLLVHAAADSKSETDIPAYRVLEGLRRPLCTLVGVEGCKVLSTRALTLARAKVPILSAVAVNPDSSFEGLGNLAAEEGSAAGIAIATQLLGLLTTFIGKDLILRIVLGVWPDLTIPDTKGARELEL